MNAQTQISIPIESVSEIVDSTFETRGFWTLKPTCHDRLISNLQQCFESVSYIHGTYNTETVGIKLVWKDKKHYAILFSDDDDNSDDESYMAFSFFDAVGMKPPSYNIEI